MAKVNKSGLGRGLNSLLGGSYDEATPLDREVIRNDTAKPSVPTQEVQHHAGKDQVTEKTERAQTVQEKIRVQTIDETVTEDNVLIKEVVERRPIEKAAAPAKVEVKEIDEVSIDLVNPNPDQPRTNFKREEIEELAASIEKDGVLQPILVRRLPSGTYQIIAGERRWQACKFAGMKKVPVRIKEADDDKALELALIENIQRSDLNPIEEAYGYKRLMERKGMTQAEVAQAMSKGRSTVANALRLLELPEEAQQLLFEEKITAGHARAILSIPNKEGRQTLTKKLLEEKMSVREAEAIARLLSGKQTAEHAAPRVAVPASYKKVARVLRDTLKTSVKVKTVKGKNKIEIEFKDEEELERLFDKLTNKTI